VLSQTHAPDRINVLCDGCSDGTQVAVGRWSADQVLDLPKEPGYGYAHRNRSSNSRVAT
jgi:hypothetical protein